MEMNENEWNVSNLIWKQHEGNEMEWNWMIIRELKGIECI